MPSEQPPPVPIRPEYFGPHTYVEKFGMGVREALAQLELPPERPMTPEQREVFFEIDSGLAEGRYERDLGEGIVVTGPQEEVEGWHATPETPANYPQ